MAQRSDRKIARVLPVVVAPVVVAVAGVSLALVGGPAQADNGQPIILGAVCSGSGTNCAASRTDIKSTTADAAFEVDAANSGAAMYGVTDSKAIGSAGVWGAGGGPSDIGVLGTSADIGVSGQSSDGIGMEAYSQSGTALSVVGKAVFSNSGEATVAGTPASPLDSVQVRLPKVSTTNHIDAKSLMTALLQERVPGVYVVAAVPNVRGNFFTIYLNKTVTTNVGPIAWMVTQEP